MVQFERFQEDGVHHASNPHSNDGKSMERVKSILKVSEQGVSKPYLCTDEKDGVRWCKGNHTGLRSVISEWICARLARQLGLPVPDFAILKLDPTVFRNWRNYQENPVPEIVTDFNPYVFGSLNVEGCKDVVDPRTELRHIDKVLLGRIFLFDQLIRNTDRTDFNSNLLVNGSVYIIDHNNAFDPGFSTAGFVDEHILREFQNALSAEEKRDFRRSIAELADGAFLEDVWSEMPSEWTDVGNEVLPLSRIRDVLKEGCDG